MIKKLLFSALLFSSVYTHPYNTLVGYSVSNMYHAEGAQYHFTHTLLNILGAVACKHMIEGLNERDINDLHMPTIIAAGILATLYITCAAEAFVHAVKTVEHDTEYYYE